eukprot:evm.model.scf_1577.3 EVM.evm.TU.scf_1577.3   scf_1577:16535-17501(-)
MEDADASPVVVEPAERPHLGNAFLADEMVYWFVGPNSRGDPRTRNWSLMDWKISMAIGCACEWPILELAVGGLVHLIEMASIHVVGQDQ